MRCWFSGRMPAFQAGDKSSILLRRTEIQNLKALRFIFSTMTGVYLKNDSGMDNHPMVVSNYHSHMTKPYGNDTLLLTQYGSKYKHFSNKNESS